MGPVYGTCPHCDKLVNRLDIATVQAHAGMKAYNGATFLCPNCHAVLGAGIDPASVASDVLKELKAKR